LCIRAKLRASPKALITKLLRETLRVASLMPEGIVISLEMIGNYYKICSLKWVIADLNQ